MTARRFFGSTIKMQGGLAYTPPLDIFNNCLAAFSVRLLRTAYTGPCIRISNTSNSEIDIGFDSNGLIDLAAVTAHVTIDQNAYIVKAYDQSGNGNDFIGQSTNSGRKQISFFGTGIYYLNGLPAFYGINSGSGSIPEIKSFLLNTRVQIGSMVVVGQIVANTTINYIGWDSTTSDGVFTGGTNASATGFGIVKGGGFFCFGK